MLSFWTSKPPPSKISLTRGAFYYEYKYLVPHENLGSIQQLMDEFHGQSDPYPHGVVDSIYYDTIDEKLLAQCVNGDADKIKFRIRGYGEGSFLQMHEKIKQLSSVRKYKCSIKPVYIKDGSAPPWEELNCIKQDQQQDFQQIQFNSRSYGPIFPSVRIRYQRFRFRTYDYRITLDTNIEASSLVNGIPRNLSYGILPYHVLEIKTQEERPKLPFIGLIKLQQVSFSKFMLGIFLLTSN